MTSGHCRGLAERLELLWGGEYWGVVVRGVNQCERCAEGGGWQRADRKILSSVGVGCCP